MTEAIAQGAFGVLGTVFVVLGWAGGLFFQFNRNARLKRFLFPKFAIAFGVLMVTVLNVTPVMSGEAPWVLLVHGPGVALYVFIMVRNIRFCDICGGTAWPTMFFRHRKCCSGCGASLDAG